MKNLFLICTLLYTVLPSSAIAYELNERLYVNGFISQGFIKSPDNAYAGDDSIDGSFKVREAALNLLWEPKDKVKLTGQVMHRQFLDAAESTELDFLFIDYQLLADSNSGLGVRLGRIKNQFGLYNSARDIPNARPGITVPNGYFNSLRGLMLSTDGLELYGHHNLDNGNLNYHCTVY